MNKNKNTGFSLLELLSAMLIGLIIVMLLSEVFVRCNHNYKIENALTNQGNVIRLR